VATLESVVTKLEAALAEAQAANLPPPPSQPVLLPAKPLKIMSVDYSAGGSDTVDISKRSPSVPWTTYAAGAPPMSFARSANGVLKPLRLMPVWGAHNVLYRNDMAVVDVNGSPEILRMLIEWSANPAAIMGGFADWSTRVTGYPHIPFPLNGGDRGEAIFTPYTTWHGHTRIRDDGTIGTNVEAPMWIGVTMNGQEQHLLRDGRMRVARTLPFSAGSYIFDFTFLPDRRTYAYTDTAAGNLMRLNRDTGLTETLTTGLGKLTSIKAVGDMIFCVNNASGDVVEFDPATGNKRLVCTLPHAFWIDTFSNGELAIGALDVSLYRVNAATGAVVRMTGPFSNPPQEWIKISVDKHGSVGPKGDTMFSTYIGSNNIGAYRIPWLGGPNSLALQGGNGSNCLGYTGNIPDGGIHYPWDLEVHPDPQEGCMLGMGGAQQRPALFGVITDGDYPPPFPRDSQLESFGFQMIGWGGAFAGSNGMVPGRPSFTCQMGQGGGGLVTFDWLAEQSFADQAAFWRAGGIGSVPRTLSNTELKPLMYYSNHNSQRHLREGRALIDNLFAYLGV
jgi:hypothetical protein